MEVDRMQQVNATMNTELCTKYTDLFGKTREVKHGVALSDASQKETEERIVQELYRIFTHKAD